MVLNDAQQKVIAYVPKIPASLSILGSCFVACLILRNPKNEKRTIYHRILLAMSLCDICSSTAQFLGTWPTPEGTPMVWGAAGTAATCTAQGTFAQFSMATIVYNGTLALYYFLTIVRGWKAEHFATIEPYLHAHALLWGVATSVPMAALGYMNPTGWDCWMAPYPAGCKESYKNNGVTTCERGDGASIFQIAFYFAPLWVVSTFITCSMVYILYDIKAKEGNMVKYSTVIKTSSAGRRPADCKGVTRSMVEGWQMTQENFKRTIAFSWQAFFYVLSYYYCFLWATIFHIWYIHGTFEPDTFFGLFFMVVITIPAQGFFNMMIFLRPRYISHRKTHPGDFFIVAWFKMLAFELSSSDRGERGSTTGSPRHQLIMSVLKNKNSLPLKVTEQDNSSGLMEQDNSSSALETWNEEGLSEPVHVTDSDEDL